jgi:hypothetical protein
MGKSKKHIAAARRALAERRPRSSQPGPEYWISRALLLAYQILKQLEMNHATITKTADDKVAARLLHFMEMDAEWLFNLRMEDGMTWLDERFGKGSVRDQLAGSKLFWAWWSNAWASYDAMLSQGLRVMTSPTPVLAHSESEDSTCFFHEPAAFCAHYQGSHHRHQKALMLDAVILQSIIKTGKKAQ